MAKLLKEYESLPSVLDNADKIRNKRVHDGLINCREEAFMSKELVTIVRDVDINYSIESFLLQSLMKIYYQKNMKSWSFMRSLNK